MKSGNIQLLDLDFEFKLWKNKILHFKDELAVVFSRILALQKEYEEFSLEKHNTKLLENQEKLLKATESKIITLENEMACYAKDYPINESHAHYVNHENLRSEIRKINLNQVEIGESIIPMLSYPMIRLDLDDDN
jgi:hypothetical protein